MKIKIKKNLKNILFLVGVVCFFCALNGEISEKLIDINKINNAKLVSDYDLNENVEFMDAIIFGKYEQDGNRNNGKEDIEWLILKRENGRVLLLSKYIIDTKQYLNSNDNVVKGISTLPFWRSCDLRKWLNGEFLNNAFTKSEIEQILPSKTKSTDCFIDNIKIEKDSIDKVFCLCVNDVKKYLKPNNIYLNNVRLSTKMKNNKKRGYWLCDNLKANTIAYVTENGQINEYENSGYLSLGVRPAIWLKDENIKKGNCIDDRKVIKKELLNFFNNKETNRVLKSSYDLIDELKLMNCKRVDITKVVNSYVEMLLSIGDKNKRWREKYESVSGNIVIKSNCEEYIIKREDYEELSEEEIHNKLKQIIDNEEKDGYRTYYIDATKQNIELLYGTYFYYVPYCRKNENFYKAIDVIFNESCNFDVDYVGFKLKYVNEKNEEFYVKSFIKYNETHDMFLSIQLIYYIVILKVVDIY